MVHLLHAASSGGEGVAEQAQARQIIVSRPMHMVLRDTRPLPLPLHTGIARWPVGGVTRSGRQGIKVPMLTAHMLPIEVEIVAMESY